ncbi:MAG: homocysteine S-methyltransferase family protein [Phycisphaerales bacterium]|nr:MAG: homocysteine S-methyltransferase family protein [Phycisphaerales bacterium]
MEPLLQRLGRGDVLVADGAMGTMLFERGLRPGQCPEAVNLERPELLEEIAGLYLDAGAEIIQTNTFGASPAKLAMYGLEDRTSPINTHAAQAVRRAVGGRALVSGSCGPSGRLLRPYGDADPDDIFAGFRRQMQALIDARVDLICVETMTDLTEATLAIKAAKEVSSDVPVMATMTFDPTPRGFFTIMGVSVEQAAAGLIDAGADVIGSNCGNGIENMVRIARQYRACTDHPLLIQSNAGMPKTQDDRLVYDDTPEFMARKAKDLLAAGVSIIGGCCGTTPDHIRAISAVVDAARS